MKGTPSRTRRASPEISTALHESGHAVAAMLLGSAPEFMTIDPGVDGVNGTTMFDSRLPDEHLVLVLLAGPIAGGRGFMDGANSGDLMKAIDLIPPGSLADQQRTFSRARRRAVRLVRDHRPEIEALAAVLLAETTLRGDRVREIVNMGTASSGVA